MPRKSPERPGTRPKRTKSRRPRRFRGVVITNPNASTLPSSAPFPATPVPVASRLIRQGEHGATGGPSDGRSRS